MGNKKSKEQQLNMEIKQISEVIEVFIKMCEEYQMRHNGFQLGEEEETLYIEKIFSYYTFIAFKIDDFKKIKNNSDVDNLLIKYDEKINYIKSLIIIKNNKEVLFESILKDRVDKDINGKNDGVKVLKFRISGAPLKQELLSSAVGIVIGYLSIFALSGFFPWGNWTSIISLSLFIVYFLGMKIILRFLMLIFGKKLIYSTMGLIMMLPFIISLTLACIFPIFFKIENYLTFIIIALMSEAIRKFIIDYFNDKKLKKKMKKVMGEE